MDHRLRLLAICNYPSDTRPALQVFVRNLLLELASLGVEITVIAPESLWNLAKPATKFRLAPAFEVRDGLRIHRPRYVDFANISLPFGIRTSKWSAEAYASAVLREVGKLKGHFDICLGYFLYPHGQAAALVGKKLGIPSVVALGESSFGRYKTVFRQQEISRLLGQFSGVFTNSALIKDYCVQQYGLAEEKTGVFPNGVDENRFSPQDRQLARQQCGLPPDQPIIISVGQFIERKGPFRTLQAIQSRPEIGAVFLGYGPQVPTGSQVLYQGTVQHKDVPVWLSAADVFVLPTLDEGCSNAILEALFCGLPVVSSDLPFNRGILNQEVSILVDPLNVEALGNAIFSLIDNPEQRKGMRRAAMEHTQSFRLSDRARRILNFLRNCLQPA